jgi:hypothetical protein
VIENCTIAAASGSGHRGHGIQGGIAHERWAEKASRTSLVVVLFFPSWAGRHRHHSGQRFARYLSINDGMAECMLLWHIHTMRRSGKLLSRFQQRSIPLDIGLEDLPCLS